MILDIRGRPYPEPTQQALSAIMEKSPWELQVVIDDEDCVKTLRVTLPLPEYKVERVEETGESYIGVYKEKRAKVARLIRWHQATRSSRSPLRRALATNGCSTDVFCHGVMSHGKDGGLTLLAYPGRLATQNGDR